jgi:DNA repair protein RecO (recombination protein O)
MEWRDEGLVIGVKRHGEAGVIAELMTAAHGRYRGMVRNGRSQSMQPVLQPGNGVMAVWRARLDEHLGAFAIEGTRLRAGTIITCSTALHGVNLLAFWGRLLPERDPSFSVYQAMVLVADYLDDPAVAPALLVRFELAVLSELGFGLDLSRCAATGQAHDLVYVSPRSGRAVSRLAGARYAAKLLRLPPFLTGKSLDELPPVGDLLDGFRLTGYFLERHILGPRALPPPDPRLALIGELQRRSATPGRAGSCAS